MPEARQRNSGAMVLVVAIQLVATAVGTALAAIAVHALVGATASATVLALIGGIIVVRLALVTVDWWTTTYVLEGDAIGYRIGRLFTSEQRIAYASVHGVRRDEPWLLKLLGRAELSIEHGAGDGQQLHFTALRASAVDEILARVEAASPGVVPDATVGRYDAAGAGATKASATPDADAPPLLRYAIARGRYLLALPLALAALGIVAQASGTDYAAAFALVRDAWLAQLPIVQAVVAIIVAVTVVAIGVGARFVSIAGYRRVLSARSLETRQGFIGSSERSLARSDVTVVELRRPGLYRALGRTMLFVSGGSGRGDPPLDLAPDVTVEAEETAASWAMPAPGGPAIHARTQWIHVVAIALLSAVVGTGLVVAVAGLGAAWGWGGAILVALIAATVLARSRMRLALHASGGVEIARTWITSRRWRLGSSSILHVEVVHSPFGNVLPTDTLRLVVADRGARTFTIRGLTRAEATHSYAVLRETEQLGAYSDLRNHQR